MNKVINGKRYNTETATRVGEAEYLLPTDMHWWHEELYLKRTGEFFVAGEGGAGTEYAEQIEANTWTSGKKIIPMTDKEARAWVEIHCDGDVYDRLWPGSEDDEPVTLCVHLPAETDRKLRDRAAGANMTISKYLTQVVNNLE